MDYLSIANAPVFWGLCGITVLISLGQALLFMRQANKTSAEVNLPQELPKKAFKIGMISAIGPACGVFIVMVGLMASIGGPGCVFPLLVLRRQSCLRLLWEPKLQEWNLAVKDIRLQSWLCHGLPWRSMAQAGWWSAVRSPLLWKSCGASSAAETPNGWPYCLVHVPWVFLDI